MVFNEIKTITKIQFALDFEQSQVLDFAFKALCFLGD